MILRPGVGDRHLRRLFLKHVGAPPIAVAQSRRVHLARRLLDESGLSITEIALSAGFSSVRRFNEVFRRTFSKSPSEVRRVKRPSGCGEVLLRLPLKLPYDWNSMISFLSKHFIPGVEVIEPGVYRRSIEISGVPAGFEVRRLHGKNFFSFEFWQLFPQTFCLLLNECAGCSISTVTQSLFLRTLSEVIDSPTWSGSDQG
jgi:AraC family transcriptional regulator of adaptative response / DNA-3-methyladenine glycosylase II